MNRITISSALFAAVLLSPALAFAKDTDAPMGAPSLITSGLSTVSWDTNAPTTNGNCAFTYNGLDNCYQTFWFFRAGGDTQETLFPPPDSIIVNADNMEATWSDVAGRGLFSATLTMRVFDAAGGTAEWRQAMEMVPISPNATDFQVFHYLDLDVAGNLGNDVAQLTHANDLIEVSDGSHLYIRGVGADAYQVQTFSSGALRGLLTDAAVTNLDNTGAPFGPADFTSAQQWRHHLRPGYPVTLEVVVGLNRPAMPQGSTVLNFDETPRPTAFADTVGATTEYLAQGVQFGPAAGASMGFLDVSGFTVPVESTPNGLAYNDGLTFQNGDPVGASVAMGIGVMKRIEVRGGATDPGSVAIGCFAGDRPSRYDVRVASTSLESMVLDGPVGGFCQLFGAAGSSGFFDDLAFTPMGLWTFDSLDATGCSSGDVSFTVNRANQLDALPFSYETIVRANGLTYMHEVVYAPFDGTGEWGLYDTANGGPTNGVWPLPAGTPLEITAILRNPEGGVDQVNHLVLSQCDGGTLTRNENRFDSIYDDGFYSDGNLDSQ